MRLRKLEFWEGIRGSVLEKFEDVMKLFRKSTRKCNDINEYSVTILFTGKTLRARERASPIRHNSMLQTI